MKKLIILICVVILNSSFIIHNCSAQWIQTNGPYGNGTIECFAVSGNNIFGGSYGFGVFLSANNGDSWSQTSLNYKCVLGLFANGTNIFAGTSEGAYRTTNNGQNWVNVNNGFGGIFDVYSFASLGANLFAGTDDGVYVSTNNGNNWSSRGLSYKYVTALVASGTNLFAGTWSGSSQDSGVYLSTNNGVNWTPAGLTHINIKSLVSDGNRVYALGIGVNNFHIYLTTNNGGNWNIIGGQITDLYSIGVSGTTLFAGTYAPPYVGNRIFRSSDYGASWYSAYSGLCGSSAIYSFAANGNYIFTATEGSWRTDVYRSTNNGDNWTVSNTGMLFKFVPALASIGTNIFAGTYAGGIFRSSNNGDSWTEVSDSLPDLTIISLASLGSNLFAGVFDYGIYKSTNNGGTWFASGLANQKVRVLLTNGNNIYAGLGTAYGGGSVFLSTNNGSSWNSLGLAYKDIYALAVVGSSIFAGVNNDSLYRTTNNGVNWIPVNNGISQYVISLTAVGTNIFAGTYGNGIYVSTNNGNNWSPVNNGLPDEYSYVIELLSSGSNIFAGISNSYSQTVKLIYLSTNNGNTWINKSQGLDTVISEVWSMLVANNYIFAGTKIHIVPGEFGKSVWRRSYSEIIGIQNISEEIPSSFALRQNYPNPFNPVTKIKFEIAKLCDVRITVFDVMGREVKTLVNETLQPGTYETTFDGLGLSSGVYFARLEAGTFNRIIRMLMIK